MTEIINYDAGIYPFFRDILKTRITQGKANVILVCGEPGIGKSYLLLKLFTAIDPTFNVDRVCWDYPQFHKAIQKLKRGQCIMLDESAWAVHMRDWHQQVNRAIVKLLQTWRFMMIPLGISTINANLLDKTVRRYLLSFKLIVTDRGYAKIYRIQASQFKDEVYHHNLGELYTGLPDKTLIDVYEAKKAKYQKEQYRLDALKIKQKQQTEKPVELLIMEGLKHLTELTDEKGKIRKFKVMKLLHISEWKARFVKEGIEEALKQSNA